MRSTCVAQTFVVFITVASLVLAPHSAVAIPIIGPCTISTTGVSFGSYNVYDLSAVDSTGSITYNCAAGTAAIAIDVSKGTSSTYLPRTMTSGSDTLGYNLFIDAARTTVWGDGTGGTSHYTTTSPPANSNVTLTVYGRIPALQDIGAGSYSDTLVITVNF